MGKNAATVNQVATDWSDFYVIVRKMSKNKNKFKIVKRRVCRQKKWIFEKINKLLWILGSMDVVFRVWNKLSLKDGFNVLTFR